MKVTHRFTAVAFAAVFGAGMLGAPVAARASDEGRRNTAIGLGAAAAYLLLTQKDKVPGLIAGAGAAYAYKKYDDARRDRDRYGYYDRYDRYDRNRDTYHDRYNDRYYRSERYNDRNYNDRYDSRNRYDSRYDYRNDRDCEDDRYFSTRRR